MEKEFIKTIDDIIKLFYDEFKPITDKFIIIKLRFNEAKNSREKYVSHPGVYAWYNLKKGPIKVGRHIMNSRKASFGTY